MKVEDGALAVRVASIDDADALLLLAVKRARERERDGAGGFAGGSGHGAFPASESCSLCHVQE